MFKNNCKCGATTFYLEYKGNNVGKYCSGCNKWQRWVGKKDREIYLAHNYIIFEDKNPTKFFNVVNDIDNFKPCTKCNSTDYYLKYKGEMVGKYCCNCDKWSTWVNRLVLKELINRGFKIESESYINPNLNSDVLPSLNDTNLISSNTSFNCVKCGSTEFYIKERGNNIGKYCSGCNKWVKWISKSDCRLLERQGMKLHPSTYVSQCTNINKDTNTLSNNTPLYVDNSIVYSDEYDRKNSNSFNLGIEDNTNIQEPNTLYKDNNKNNIDSNIDKKEHECKETDLNISKNNMNIQGFNYTLDKNNANIFLLDKFISHTPNDCIGCILETKCDMMQVKLCDSIKDVIEFIEDSGVF